jgi:hypothetical protein
VRARRAIGAARGRSVQARGGAPRAARRSAHGVPPAHPSHDSRRAADQNRIDSAAAAPPGRGAATTS